MLRIQLLVLCSFSLFLSSCSIKQTVEPAELEREAQVCVVKNSAVRASFLDALENILLEKDISYKLVDKENTPKECEWTVTYVAKWSWDLALYMSYAEIKVLHNGVLDGEAIYDSTLGGANMNKFIDAEEKLRELVNELLEYKTTLLFRPRFG